MTMHETDDNAVLDALKHSLDGVVMHTPTAEIVGAAKARGRRRRVAGSATGALAVGALTLGLTSFGSSPTPDPTTNPGDVQVRTVAFTLARHPDGSIHVTWDKQRYFDDHAGLEQALDQAGFPVVIRDGEFCTGPGDDASLDGSGVGAGVDKVMRGRREPGGRVTIVFTPAAMPAGKRLFIGYLSPAQLAVTHGRPGSVERLVSAQGPLTCSTQAPPPGTGADTAG
jgi:hypothetical protein